MTACSVQFSCSVVSDSLWPHELQRTRPPCPSPTPGVYSNSCPLWCTDKESACQCRRCKGSKLNPCVGKLHWGRTWEPTPILLPGKFHGQRSAAGYSPWGRKEWDVTECAHTQTQHRQIYLLGELNIHRDKGIWILGIIDQSYHECKIQKILFSGLPWWLRWSRICLQCGKPGFDPWVGKIPWRREWQPTPVFLPGESFDRGALWATVHGSQRIRHNWATDTFTFQCSI